MPEVPAVAEVVPAELIYLDLVVLVVLVEQGLALEDRQVAVAVVAGHQC
jgi:hypothetical protein